MIFSLFWGRIRSLHGDFRDPGPGFAASTPILGDSRPGIADPADRAWVLCPPLPFPRISLQRIFLVEGVVDLVKLEVAEFDAA